MAGVKTGLVKQALVRYIREREGPAAAAGNAAQKPRLRDGDDRGRDP